MGRFFVIRDSVTADFLVEKESCRGVRMIAETVAEDLKLICKAPDQREQLADCRTDRLVLIGTDGKSPLLKQLEQEGKLSPEEIRGKREVYLMQVLETPFLEYPQIKEVLVIAGSDKRGTIYGMFRLSELCGVSPLIYFGDALPARQTEAAIELDEVFVSREPSVKYRGFFINDEWPAFGNWCREQFGGINAKAYQRIFELLLRLKGNYLWPAMWRSSFSEDGPGLLSAELADTYGVIMGLSHHEPMCRAGVEWQQKYKQYGNDSTWSFLTNADAITKFWEDGLLRNRSFENVITIGMRGENDSKLMPEDATLKDNIDVIKKAIRAQHALIQKHLSPELKEVPRMLAIYKEVEDYYVGDETCEGLKDWDELKDVIFLLSDDNYGNLRGLPTGETRNHPGGYGMYYHFDYHGAPVSYEWTNTNRLTKTWEQMTQAYEAGVREMWIVNVGDLKAVEYPLCYFMELAYDYETWGGSAANRTERFAEQWVDQQFGARLTPEQKKQMLQLMEGYTKWNAARTPEAMREGIYHPVHFRESDRVWHKIHELTALAEQLNQELTGEALETYQSILYYPAAASMNLILMYLEAGINKMLAKRGCLSANTYAESVKKRILDDIRYVEEYHRILNGKWNHIMDSAHTGFRDWDDKDWTYPTVETVSPLPIAKSVVSFRGSDLYHLGAHWQDRGPLINDDFTRPDTKEVLLDLDCRGNVPYSFEIVSDCAWLLCPEKTGCVDPKNGGRKTLHFEADRTKLQGKESAGATVKIAFDNGQRTFTKLLFWAENEPEDLPKQKYLFLERQGYCAIAAEHFTEKKDVEQKGFRVIRYLGREGSAIKAFPAMEHYPEPQNAPYVTYSMLAEQTAAYRIHFYLPARNPSEKGKAMRFAVSVNEGEPTLVNAVSDHYYTEWFDREWANGVLDHVRIVTVDVSLQKGKNDICFYAGDPGILLEKLVVCPAGCTLPESYLGPEESYCIKQK